jgi:hypothetical protein
VNTRAPAPAARFPGTTFTAARQQAYALSQQTRAVLPDDALDSFFRSGGRIDAQLEPELLRRHAEKRQRGHACPVGVPDTMVPGDPANPIENESE